MPARVLIVDHDAAFRAEAGDLLRRRGFAVVGVAADGRSATRSVRDLRPEGVILGLELPDADGCDVAREIVEFDSDVRVVLTAAEPTISRRQLSRCGAIAFVTKTSLADADLEEWLVPADLDEEIDRDLIV